MTTTHRMTTTAAVILSLAAAGAPTATATVSGTTPATTANQPPASVYSRPDKSMIRVTTPASAPQAVVRITTPPNGFDWGDAGIGAAGGLALAMIGLGGALVVSHGAPAATAKPSRSADEQRHTLEQQSCPRLLARHSPVRTSGRRIRYARGC